MKRVLIAEDERDIRELVDFALRYSGYEVLTARDGEEAFDLILKEKPDLVLLDVRMPRMSGFEVCRRMKNGQATRNIPVIFLSAKTQDTEIQAGLDAGAEAYIVKPFSTDHLVAQVASLLDT